jgi:O-acetyl-ADP-ribose deacetylase (regulator of RNase III)
MTTGPRQGRITVQHIDITQLKVDAIVNAANETLLGGGGVDGAIHRAAGPELLAACRALPQLRPGVRCPTGEARITPGFRLLARHVIHTVGPVWYGGHQGEPEALAACYRSVMEISAAHSFASLAFPAISCGVYGYPLDAAARIATHELQNAVAKQPGLQAIVIACFSDAVLEAYRQALQPMTSP